MLQAALGLNSLAKAAVGTPKPSIDRMCIADLMQACIKSVAQTNAVSTDRQMATELQEASGLEAVSERVPLAVDELW